MQLMNGEGEDGAGQLLGSLLWPTDGAKPDAKKTGLLEMLASLMELNPGQFDFRQLSLMESDGGMALDLDAVQEVGKLAPDRLGAWLASLGGLAEQDVGGLAKEAGEAVEGLGTLLQDALPRPPGAEMQKDGLGQVADAAPAKALADEAGGIRLKVLGYEGADRSGSDMESALPGQEQFRQAVQAARDRLSDKGSKRESNPAEILLAQSARHAAGGFAPADAKPTETQGIPEQIFLGLSQNVKAGRGEFVIKLMPEGLGEITVRLLAKEGRTTLRIITASAETARLINNDLAALQNALKPIRVEVHQAVPETAADREADGYFAGFDQFEQFSQFNGYGNQGEANPSYGGTQAADAADDLEAGMMEPVVYLAPDDALNMYV
jgi:hypothetical protein